MKRIAYTSLFIISFGLCYGQENDFSRKPDTTVFKEISSPGWVRFRDSYNTPPEKVFEQNKRSFGLGESYAMKVVRTRDDSYGYRHIKFQQTYRDIKVLGGEYIIHAKNGKAYTGNGKIYTPGIIKSISSFSEIQALNIALKDINASSYYWQDMKRELDLKHKTGDPMATYHPKAELVYVPSEDKSSLVLCYSFIIMTRDFGKSAISYIDAANGTLIKKDHLDHSCTAAAVNTNWNGTRAVFTNDIGGSFDLEDDCQESVYGVYDVTSSDNIFNSPNNLWSSDWLRSAATSLWAIKHAYYWFRTFFGREGHDHDDGDIDIYQGATFTNNSPNNASYTYDPRGDDEIKFGIGDSPSVLDDWNTLDIASHEFTHGINQYEAALGKEKEPGALNESFGDIFGEWVESKVLGNTDWIHGAERDPTNCSRSLRNFTDPSGQNITVGGCTMNFGLPNTYLTSPNWYSTTGPAGDDKWGIHTNCGVQNQMFYLLAVGGNGWNNGKTCHAPADSGYAWSVSGIGIDNAARIGYKALNDYLTSESTYPDARHAWVLAAENIFGTCSFEAIQTGKAWYAVGIAPPALQTHLVCFTTYGQVPYTLITPKNITVEPGCIVSILNTDLPVEFRSGGRITLGAGFISRLGSRFKARIADDCAFTAY